MPEIVTALIEGLENPACDSTPSPQPKICIRLPFGLEFCYGKTNVYDYEGNDKHLLSLIAFLQPLLSPMMMILTLASMVKALIDCVKAIPDAVSSLSPTPIIECIEKLAEIFPKLAQFIPPLTFIGLILDITRVLILLIDVLIEAVETATELAAQLLLFEVDLDLIPDLSKYSDCVNEEIATQLDQIVAALNAVGPIFSILAGILDLLGLPGLSKSVEKLNDSVAIFNNASVADLNEDLVADLRGVRDILVTLEMLLAAFDSGSSEITLDLSGE